MAMHLAQTPFLNFRPGSRVRGLQKKGGDNVRRPQSTRFRFVLLVAALLAVIASLAPPGQAQVITGNIYALVVDEKEEPLPGVTVTLTGIGAPLTQVSNKAGEVRFLNLSPGDYKISATLAGFAPVTRGD